VITKLVAGTAITVAAAVAVSAPASADPSVFNILSCTCQQTLPKGGPAVMDQINRGIQTGLADLQGIPRRE
jgi:hypothetical protein